MMSSSSSLSFSRIAAMAVLLCAGSGNAGAPFVRRSLIVPEQMLGLHMKAPASNEPLKASLLGVTSVAGASSSSSGISRSTTSRGGSTMTCENAISDDKNETSVAKPEEESVTAASPVESSSSTPETTKSFSSTADSVARAGAHQTESNSNSNNEKVESTAVAVSSQDTANNQESDTDEPRGIWRIVPRSKKSNHKQIARTLKNRNHTNKRRKFMHCSFGLFFATLNHLVPRNRFVPGMAILSSATLLMELLRYRNEFGWMNDALHFVLGKSLRKHEMEGKFTGSFYFFTGVTLTAALFPTHAATLGMIQLAVADPTASYFGRQTRHIYWSRIENGLGGFGRNKGILGFLGGAVCCVPVNYRILSLMARHTVGLEATSRSLLLAASAALGGAGAFADLAVPTPALVLPKRILGVRVPPFHIDDNCVVPIFSGYFCTQLFQYLGWTSEALNSSIQLAPLIFV